MRQSEKMTIKPRKSIEKTISLTIDTEYSTFSEFLRNEKHKIYTKIIDAFEDIIKNNIKEKILIVSARAEGTVFNTRFEISEKSKDMLKETISPYFEKIEEYETCSRISELYLKFKKN